MLIFFDKLRGLIKSPDVLTDALLFTVHCKLTSIALFACCLITTATEWVGESIKCLDDSGKEMAKAVVTWCWIQSKYTMADSATRALLDDDYEPEKRYYPYYQWVGFALFGQAVFCYMPKYFWDAYEKKLLQQLIMELNKCLPSQAEMKEKKINLLRYLLSHAKMHKLYVLHYWFLEGMCLVNVLCQIVFMNVFLGGEFLGYGWQVLSFFNKEQEDRVDPMIYLFPRMTKCEFFKYGPSQSVVNQDALCLLPINNTNEKIYVVIWVWYLMLAPLLVLLIAFRLLISGWIALRVLLLRGTNQLITRRTAEAICNWGDVGDFWIVFMLSTNIRASLFNSILEQLREAIENPDVHYEIMGSSSSSKVDSNKKPQGGKGDCILNIG